MNSTVCDECGIPATVTIMGMTGRVLIDDVDNNRQSASGRLLRCPCAIVSDHASAQ